VSIDGQSVRSIADVRMLMGHYGGGEEVSVTALSRDKYVTADLQLRTR
jgi:hypothetical protein